ncbi:MAG: hypothetical protein ACK6BG_05010 [Cyanobacteriota bacterium]
MKIILFGSNNPTGAAFLHISNEDSIEIWGRSKPSKPSKKAHIYCDLANISARSLNRINGVIVSFAPIWLLAPFLLNLMNEEPGVIENLRGIIACSSSSFMTKRFAFNSYDKKLSQCLESSHEQIAKICQTLCIPFQILAPTMIYGEVHGYSDKNLSKLVRLMRFTPFILLPESNGLRQPIHASQLARVAYRQAEKIWTGSWEINEPQVLALGGDSILSYKDMLLAIKQTTSRHDSAQRCYILTMPDRFFFFLIAFLLPINPKLFEAMMRINTDLSNFKMAHHILGEEPLRFPIHP